MTACHSEAITAWQRGHQHRDLPIEATIAPHQNVKVPVSDLADSLQNKAVSHESTTQLTMCKPNTLDQTSMSCQCSN